MRSVNEVGWINKFLSPESDIAAHQIQSVLYFSLLWNLFEGQVCETEADIPKIKRAVQTLQRNGNLRIAEYDDCREYFIRRYVENGNVSPLFDQLNLRTQNKSLVRDMLEGRETRECEVLQALLLIAYRYRNNLFHGVKSLPDLPSQNSNFQNANRLIMIFMDQWQT